MQPHFFAVAICASLFFAACSPTEQVTATAEPPLEFGYPLDDVLRLNHIQMKGTHNSYHLAPTDTIAEWNYRHPPLTVQLAEQGVRQFELDIHYDAAEGRFAVYHVPADEGTTCEWFTDCLTELLSWSNANRGHHALFVLVETKDDLDSTANKIAGRYEELDAEVLSVWPRGRVITPDDVKGGAATLAEAVETRGWPTLGESRGKIVFAVLDRNRRPGGHHYNYTHGNANLDGRVMFVTAAQGEPYAGILILDDPIRDEAAIESGAKANYLIRTRANDDVVDGFAESDVRLEAARSGGAHMLSTDYPLPIVEGGYWLDLTGGTPSRCNPLTAPAECKSDAIEAASRLQPID